MSETIDVEASPAKEQSMAVERRPQPGALGQALSVKELHERLEYIRTVMKTEMREGTDYGKIPGTGDKPSLLQPGAQKLLMTFNLRAQVEKEVLREFPTLPLHREYEFTLRVFPAGMDAKLNGTDGAGNCSTLESKYRYRKAERKCPICHKATIITGKEEYGGGFICWKKKGGCDAKFKDDDTRITSQPADVIDNEDPADCWNTVRKMAYKRALVAAVINFTNTSELWTQDVEDMAGNEATAKEKATQRQAAQATPRTSAPAGKPAGHPAPVASTALKPATAQTRAWMIRQLHDCADLALEYFRKLDHPAVLLDTETLEDVGLEFVPITSAQLKALKDRIADFGNGGEVEHAFKPNPQPIPSTPKKKPAKTGAKQPAPHVEKEKARDPEWFFDVICPVPRKGMKRDDYMSDPDTIGSLYRAGKQGDDESRKRLFGFANNWQPAPREFGGKTYQPTEADHLFREALDAFMDWEKKKGADANSEPAATARQDSIEPPGGWQGAAQGAEPQDDVPF